MHMKMNGKHVFIAAMLLLVLIGMSLIVKGTPERLTAASDTETRNFAEIQPNTPELFKRVCGMHSFKCGRRRSAVIKVRKKGYCHLYEKEVLLACRTTLVLTKLLPVYLILNVHV